MAPISKQGSYQPGTDPSSLWFRMDGVPAVVMIGADALWTELAELSAVADARIHVLLDIAVIGARGAVHGPNERKNGVKALHEPQNASLANEQVAHLGFMVPMHGKNGEGALQELIGGGVSILNSKSEIGNLKSGTGS